MSALVRVRDLRLTRAPSAEMLSALRLEAGIEGVEVVKESVLKLRYRLAETTLSTIIHWLSERDLRVDATPLNHARVALLKYMDTVQSESMRNDSKWDTDLRRLYISRQPNRGYSREERARHWRKYLVREEGMQ